MKTKDAAKGPGFVEAHYSLWGERFFPSRIKVSGNVEIINAIDPGDIGKIGKYRGKPTPYGSCDVRCTRMDRSQIVYLAAHLKRHLALYRKHEATDIVFWIIWTGVQGNMEFTVQELRKLADMRIPVAMDYIHSKT